MWNLHLNSSEVSETGADLIGNGWNGAKTKRKQNEKTRHRSSLESCIAVFFSEPAFYIIGSYVLGLVRKHSMHELSTQELLTGALSEGKDSCFTKTALIAHKRIGWAMKWKSGSQTDFAAYQVSIGHRQMRSCPTEHRDVRRQRWDKLSNGLLTFLTWTIPVCFFESNPERAFKAAD